MASWPQTHAKHVQWHGCAWEYNIIQTVGRWFLLLVASVLAKGDSARATNSSFVAGTGRQLAANATV